MAERKRKVTLYFTTEAQLTEEDVATMDRIVGDVRHRNASMVDPEAKLEACDHVAGPAVPPQYAEKFTAPAMIGGEDGGEVQTEQTAQQDKKKSGSPWAGNK